MEQPITILGISGSLRRQSFNTAALRAAQALAPSHVSFDFADMRDIPIYDWDSHQEAGVPERVMDLARQVEAADALLFATPEYNYSLPGGLKNAIDWLSRLTPHPFAGKGAAIMSASRSALGGARAQYDLRRVLVYLDVHCVNKPEVMISFADKRFDEEGRLSDDTTRGLIAQQVAALADWARRLRAEG